MTYGDHITTYKAKILHNAQEAKKNKPIDQGGNKIE